MRMPACSINQSREHFFLSNDILQKQRVKHQHTNTFEFDIRVNKCCKIKPIRINWYVKNLATSHLGQKKNVSHQLKKVLSAKVTAC